MAAIFVTTAVVAVFFALTYVAWRRYLWAAEKVPHGQADTCQYTLTDVFGDRPLVNVPHQKGIRWLTEVFSRSAEKFPHLTALQIPHTGESLTFAELNARAESVAAALSPFLTGPDQVVAVAMSQDNWQIVASHLGILKAGGTVMFLDTTLPDALIAHMLNDAQPVVILTRGQDKFRDLPTLDVLTLPQSRCPKKTATLAGRSNTAPCDHLLHERHHWDAQGRRVPARGLCEPGPELRRLLRSPSRHGCNLAYFVAGLRRQHPRDVQRLGVGLRCGNADQGADPIRPGPRSRPPRS